MKDISKSHKKANSDRLTDRAIDRQTDSKTARPIERQTMINGDSVDIDRQKQISRESKIHKFRQTNSQIVRQTDTQ